MKRFSYQLLVAALFLAAPFAVASEKPSAFETMAAHYESIRATLVNDSTSGVKEHAAALRDQAKALESKFDAADAGVVNDKAGDCQELLPDIAAAADRVAAAEDLAGVRAVFGDLSKAMIRFRSMAEGVRPIVVYCPMIKLPWMQPKGEIGNPYYGQSMARCGQIVAED